MINKEEIDFDFTSDTTEPDYNQEVIPVKKQSLQKKPTRKPKIERLDSDLEVLKGESMCYEGEEELKPNEKITKHWTFTN